METYGNSGAIGASMPYGGPSMGASMPYGASVPMGGPSMGASVPMGASAGRGRRAAEPDLVRPLLQHELPRSLHGGQDRGEVHGVPADGGGVRGGHVPHWMRAFALLASAGSSLHGWLRSFPPYLVQLHRWKSRTRCSALFTLRRLDRTRRGALGKPEIPRPVLLCRPGADMTAPFIWNVWQLAEATQAYGS